MSDGNRLVACSVSGGALVEIAGGSIDAPRLTFVLHRQKIETTASAKYDRGQTDDDGGITLAAGDFQSDRAAPP